MSKIILGAIFPISEKNYNRIIKGSDIFVKYSKFNKLEVGQTIKFYISKPIGKIRIIAKIKNVNFLDNISVKMKYFDRLIMKEDEFDIYVKKTKYGDKRKNSNLLVIEFADIKKCEEQLKGIMLVSGMYIYH